MLLLSVGLLAAGILVGRMIQGRAETPTLMAGQPMPSKNEALRVDDRFPDAALIDEAGVTWTAGELIAETGAVFLFLDPACPSCEAATSRWQHAIDTGQLPAGQVIGIVKRASADLADYKGKHGLTFPIFLDAAGTFADEYPITWLPFEVQVRANGTIVATGVGDQGTIDASLIRRLAL